MEKLNEHIEFLEMTEDEPQLLVWLLELRRHRESNWQQRAETSEEDKRRMDWLESKAVNVRQPLPYGSHNIFWAQQTSDDCDEHYTTDLREQIDNAILSEGATHD